MTDTDRVGIAPAGTEPPGTEPAGTGHGSVAAVRPIWGRPSPAADVEGAMRASGDATTAALRSEGAANGWCILRAASVAGVRHRLAAQGSDDSFAWAHDGNRLAVAVADGVGSLDGSAGASRRAATAAVECAVADPADRAEAARNAVAAANRAAEGGGATTLVVAVVEPSGDGVLDVALARVGDSTALLYGGSQSGTETGEELFGAPDPERADTATAALPSPAPAVEERAAELRSGAVLTLVTDGIGDPWRDGPTTVAPALGEVLLGRPSPLELLRAADFSRRGCHDDRTLACVWPVAGAGESGGG